jgi:transposase InsO family protein
MSVEFPIVLLCDVLEISRSSFYEWKAGLTYQDNCKQQMIEMRTIAVFWENKRRYGARRVAAALQQQDVPLSLYKARRVLKRNGLTAIQPRSFVPKTTNSKHAYFMSPNLLLDRPFPKAMNEVWVGDITYIPLVNSRFCYLSVWMDLYSRRIIGWALMPHMRELIVITAFKRARKKRKINPGLIVHSDRGGQYAGNDFRRLLESDKILQSMSRADNPYDNAFMESCFSRFKAELIQNGAFESIEDARIEITEFIDGYYNTKRIHSSLGYMSPINYELVSQKTSKK